MALDTPATLLPGAPLPVGPHTPPHGQAIDAMRRAAQEFESVFLAEMMGPMFEGLDTDGLGGGGVGEQMFRPMLIDQYAHAITHAGGVGVAESITRELVRMQAGQDAVAHSATPAPAAPQTETTDGDHR